MPQQLQYVLTTKRAPYTCNAQYRDTEDLYFVHHVGVQCSSITTIIQNWAEN